MSLKTKRCLLNKEFKRAQISSNNFKILAPLIQLKCQGPVQGNVCTPQRREEVWNVNLKLDKVVELVVNSSNTLVVAYLNMLHDNYVNTASFSLAAY